MNEIVVSVKYKPVEFRRKIIITPTWIRAAAQHRKSVERFPDWKSTRTIGGQHRNIKIVALRHPAGDFMSMVLDTTKIRQETRGYHQDADRRALRGGRHGRVFHARRATAMSQREHVCFTLWPKRVPAQ